jgi:erythromycin esterase-like protein
VGGAGAVIDGGGPVVRDGGGVGREPAFARFPTWMWRNREVQGFVEWLRGWNRGVRERGGEGEVGFYGLDLYSLRASMEAVVEYLERVDPEMGEAAAKRYSRMMEWAEDPHGYGMQVLSEGFKGCEKDVVKVLKDLLEKRLEYAALGADGEEFHSAEQNARLVRGEFALLERALFTRGAADRV